MAFITAKNYWVNMGYSQEPTFQIIYYYDPSIKLYTFQFMDSEENDTRPAEYSSKHFLVETKKSIEKEYEGIKVITLRKYYKKDLTE
jgi:hypothetical protein